MDNTKLWINDIDLREKEEKHLAKKAGWVGALMLAWSSMGVIYGDIGTSPLYVFSSIFIDHHPERLTDHEILGAVCLIVWTITIIAIVKYCLIVLLADDNGEGGTFALYSLLCRHANITPANGGGIEASDLEVRMYSSSANVLEKRTVVGGILRRWLSNSQWAQTCLLVLVLIMTSMVLGDGVLTPAQSVLGAISGLKVKVDSISTGNVVLISVVIIILIFSSQQFGTSKVGSSFAPIVMFWFLGNLIISIHNIAKYYPSVFRALSPYYGYRFFQIRGYEGWRNLSGIFLAVTGTEAMYADLGHFSRASVQISFIAVAYPALIMTYLGQAAWLLGDSNRAQVSTTFYSSIPFGDAFFWIMFVSATSAAIVASQALISGSFSIVQQSVALGCFPRVRTIHTSKEVTGQIYIAPVNYVMMLLTIIVVAIFKDTVELGNAYGVAVSSMMVGTTVLMFITMLIVWEVNLFLSIVFLFVFGFIDSAFLSANLFKVPKGGWYTLAIGVVVASASYLWHWGVVTKRQALFANKTKLDSLLAIPEDDTSGSLISAITQEPLSRCSGIALMYSDMVFGAPPIMRQLIARWGTVHKITVLTTIRQIAVPSVDPDERLLFRPLQFPGIFRVVARYGYMDLVDNGPAFVESIARKIQEVNPSLLADFTDPGMLQDKTVYILSRISTNPKANSNFIRRSILNSYSLMARFAVQAWEEWEIPKPALFEVGMIADI